MIITAGATRADSGAGDDSICVTGKGAVVVNAGPGDDFVGARTHKGKTFVSLGFGDDTFIGRRRARPGLEPGGVQPDVRRTTTT